MNTSIRHLLATAMLLMPFGFLHAQENKHAQAMRTAFIETIYGKYPKNIDAKLTSFNEDSLTMAHGQWGCLDGGGLVPKEKIHVVTLSKSKSNVTASIGPLYIDGHKFQFNRVPDDPLLPLRLMLDAFDKQARYANSYYSYVAGDEQAAFPGVSIAWGEHGESFPLQLDPQMNVRIIGFKDDDGFRSTYLLSWSSKESDPTESRHFYYNTKGIRHQFYDVRGIIYEFHCPKMKSTPQVKSYDPDEYLDRTNTGLSVAHNLVRGLQKSDPVCAAELESDTLAEEYPYSYQRMVEKLYGSLETANVHTSYEALAAKVHRMEDLSHTATSTEQEAICHTLIKELNAYPFLLSGNQYFELDFTIGNMTVPEELKSQITSARTILNSLQNYTADIDSLSEMEQEYLNRNHWKLSHEPVIYNQTDFTRQGEHYSGDKHIGYLVANGEFLKNYQAENTFHGLRPGRYRLSAVVRANKTDSNHSGIYVFCQAGDKIDYQIYQKEIPADGDTGGNVWFSALCRYERHKNAKEDTNFLDFRKATANDGKGYGWNRIYIDDIIVRDGTLTYGVSTRPEITNTHHYGSYWFSACDFIVERVGD